MFYPKAINSALLVLGKSLALTQWSHLSDRPSSHYIYIMYVLTPASMAAPFDISPNVSIIVSLFI